MDRHLSEHDLEAVAHGRVELLSAQAREHLIDCETCAETVRDTRQLSESVGLALREQFSLDASLVDDLVSSVLNDVSGKELPAPPRTNLVSGLLGGLIVAAASGALSGPKLPSRWPSLSMAYEVLRVGRAVMGAIDQVVSHLPGGWGLIMVCAWLLLALLLLPARLLLARSQPPLSRLITGLMLLCVVVMAQPVRALDFEGELPEQKRVSLNVTREPTSKVLARVAEAAGLDLVSTLPEDPLVSVRVKQATLRDVLTAVLFEQSVVVRVEGKMLSVRGVRLTPPVSPDSDAGLALPPPTVPGADRQDAKLPSRPDSAVDMRPVPSAPPLPGASTTRATDRLVVGERSTVAAGERVRDAIVVGGSLTVFGVVEGDAVAIGGSIHLMPGSVVRGELIALGGSVTQEKGATVLDQRGDEQRAADRDDGADEPVTDAGDADAGEASGEDSGDSAADDKDGDEEGFVSQTLSSASSHALLFVFGLVLLGIWPQRIDALQGTISGSPLRTFALGVLGALGALVVCLLLIITIIGIPAAIVLALASALAIYAGAAAAALAIGRVLPFERLAKNPVLQLGAGVFVLFIFARIPVLGGVLFVIAAALGFGAILRTRLGQPAPASPGPGPVVGGSEAITPDETGM